MSSLEEMVSELDGQEMLSEEQKLILKKARILKKSPDDMNTALTMREREWLNDKELDFAIEYRLLKRFDLDDDGIFTLWVRGASNIPEMGSDVYITSPHILRNCLYVLYERQLQNISDTIPILFYLFFSNQHKEREYIVNKRQNYILTLIRYGSTELIKEFMAAIKPIIDTKIMEIVLEMFKIEEVKTIDSAYMFSLYLPEKTDEEKACCVFDDILKMTIYSSFETGIEQTKHKFIIQWAMSILSGTETGISLSRAKKEEIDKWCSEHYILRNI